MVNWFDETGPRDELEVKDFGSVWKVQTDSTPKVFVALEEVVAMMLESKGMDSFKPFLFETHFDLQIFQVLYTALRRLLLYSTSGKLTTRRPSGAPIHLRQRSAPGLSSHLEFEWSGQP